MCSRAIDASQVALFVVHRDTTISTVAVRNGVDPLERQQVQVRRHGRQRRPVRSDAAPAFLRGPWEIPGTVVLRVVPDASPPPHVLVVDDEEHITEMVAMGLGINGFEVERAGSGRAALDAIERRRPDLVVLDVMLPDLDGFEVARRLRQSEGAATASRSSS